VKPFYAAALCVCILAALLYGLLRIAGSVAQARWNKQKKGETVNIHDRYTEDPLFRRIVDLMTGMIESGQFTPTEIREAAMVAQINFEARHPRPTFFSLKDIQSGRV
jgi:hypothetical protein